METLHPSWSGRKVRALVDKDELIAKLEEELEKAEEDVAYYKARAEEMAALACTYEVTIVSKAFGGGDA
jgi:hypothetical protein